MIIQVKEEIMEIRIMQNAHEAGQLAGKKAAELLNQAVALNGEARFMAATGQSQLPFYEGLLSQHVSWDKIEIFHLDEYCGLPDTHPASFKKYIKERFVAHITPKAVYYIDGTSNIETQLRFLNDKAVEKPIDVGMIGFGENAHIAFNDPPADFHTSTAYHIVNLDSKCKQQQVGEGWFSHIDEVPKQAVSASVPFIQSFRNIVSLIPYNVKAPAVKSVLEAPSAISEIPGTALLEHPSWFIYLDHESSSLLTLSKIKNW